MRTHKNSCKISDANSMIPFSLPLPLILSLSLIFTLSVALAKNPVIDAQKTKVISSQGKTSLEKIETQSSLSNSKSASTYSPPFRFHLVNEPASLRPWEQKNSSAGYLYSQLMGTLLVYQDHKIKNNLAQNCKFKTKTIVTCKLKPHLKWSNGKPLIAQDFVRSFQKLIKPQNRAPQADILFPIQNAQSIFLGKLPPERLGVKANSKTELELTLESEDTEFLYDLTNPLLAPVPEQEIPTTEELKKNPSLWISSGPFKIEKWNPPQSIILGTNDFFWKKNSRPNIEINVIPEDLAALALYEKNKLDFLRRLPSQLINDYKNKPDFLQIEQFRFDYLGFSHRYREDLPLRRSISRAIHFAQLQKLLGSRGLPGCPGIPTHLMNGKPNCLEFDPIEAKSEWDYIKNRPSKFEIIYSRQGGDDHRRSIEWLQSELKKNLKLDSEAVAMDHQIFLKKLKENPPDLFRKGLAPTRPTCASALEVFMTSNPENYIQFSDPQFEELITLLKKSNRESEKAKYCSEAVAILLKNYWLIPTGPIHFSLLLKPGWKNVSINELNQLDLSEIRYER